MPPHNMPTFNKFPKGTYPGGSVKSIEKEHPLAFQLGQLRHAYAQLAHGRVRERNMTEFADGLIAPVIRAIERHIQEDCTRVQETTEEA